jgi:hypothetical protein
MEQQNSYRSAATKIGAKETGPHYWIGDTGSGVEYYAGQTFRAGSPGKLKSIQVFASAVIGDGDAHIDVYEFDEANHIWKEKKAECTQHIDAHNEGSWLQFPLHDVVLEPNKQYAFKISCNSGSKMAVAECPWKRGDLYKDGEEWTGSSEMKDGKFHHDFDLAFVAEIVSD